MEHLIVKSFGPITQAEVNFGDLTLLVGSQASGKSIFLQLLKLIVDKFHIRKTVGQFNYVWKNEKDILNLFFGEDMADIWQQGSEVCFDGKSYSKDFVLHQKGRYEGKAKVNPEEQLFYIPAQRILSIADGRPKNFMEFDTSAPYVLRYFSEALRLLLQNGMENSIFPINRLKDTMRKLFDDSIFHGGEVFLDERTGQTKFRMKVGRMNVPFITWSAGQKEFMPLLLAFYHLCPPSKVAKKDDYKYIVIEEPEMGLHPQAIKSVILQVIDLLSRNYKVIISTHSPIFLEFAWAFNLLKNSNAMNKSLYELFDLEGTTQVKQLLDNILSTKIINTYFFSRTNNQVVVKDMSSLDANSDDTDISEWGGISSFASKANDIVSTYISD
jgi:energy-coupling factor transporter ATP-binding protein EcfA2